MRTDSTKHSEKEMLMGTETPRHSMMVSRTPKVKGRLRRYLMAIKRHLVKVRRTRTNSGYRKLKGSKRH